MSSEDKEIAKINEKKLKKAGAKVVEEEKKINYEFVCMQLADYLESRGLEMMNTSRELKDIIANQRQKVRNQQIEKKEV